MNYRQIILLNTYFIAIQEEQLLLPEQSSI